MNKDLQDFINYLDIDGQDANAVAVETWLRLIGYAEYIDTFASHGYDSLTIFPNLTEKDLELAGVKREDRRKILMHNTKLKTNQGAIMDSLMKELLAMSQAQLEKEAKKEQNLLNLANLAEQAKQRELTDSPSQRVNVPPTGGRRLSMTGLYRQTEKKQGYLHGPKVYCRFGPKFSCSITSCTMKCLHCGKMYCGACLYGEAGKMKSIHQCSSCGKPPRSLPSFGRPATSSTMRMPTSPSALSPPPALPSSSSSGSQRRGSWSEPVDDSFDRQRRLEMTETQNKYRAMVASDAIII